ncbi:Histone-lysine N-methyltransferase SETMAR [Eumeta japonica]|uniref:Histone-lysine N-methyltransferase SETMAR n=1 Tax=Eumeta variegata TaxID=151549 RepID=A0A4C1XW35_EUMVA|nr:Histone-lysine N-methyltransferase SETMAR [Eumeta japonica]
MDLSSENFHSTIFYDFKSNLVAQQSLDCLRSAFGDGAPCKTTVYNWFSEFKCGRVNLSDEFRDNLPSTAVNNKNINSMRRVIETNGHATYHEIRASLGIDMSRIQSILHKYFDMKKPCSPWIPPNLTETQKTDRDNWYNTMFTRFKEVASNLVWDIVSGDKTWIYCYNPETKLSQRLPLFLIKLEMWLLLL